MDTAIDSSKSATLKISTSDNIRREVESAVGGVLEELGDPKYETKKSVSEISLNLTRSLKELHVTGTEKCPDEEVVEMTEEMSHVLSGSQEGCVFVGFDYDVGEPSSGEFVIAANKGGELEDLVNLSIEGTNITLDDGSNHTQESFILHDASALVGKVVDDAIKEDSAAEGAAVGLELSLDDRHSVEIEVYIWVEHEGVWFEIEEAKKSLL